MKLNPFRRQESSDPTVSRSSSGGSQRSLSRRASSLFSRNSDHSSSKTSEVKESESPKEVKELFLTQAQACSENRIKEFFNILERFTNDSDPDLRLIKEVKEDLLVHMSEDLQESSLARSLKNSLNLYIARNKAKAFLNSMSDEFRHPFLTQSFMWLTQDSVYKNKFTSYSVGVEEVEGVSLIAISESIVNGCYPAIVLASLFQIDEIKSRLIPLSIISERPKLILFFHSCTKCDVNAPDRFGFAPLIYSVFLRKVKSTELLLGLKANPNQALDGITPLHLACRDGKEVLQNRVAQLVYPKTDKTMRYQIEAAIKGFGYLEKDSRKFTEAEKALITLLIACQGNLQIKNNQGVSPEKLMKPKKFNPHLNLLENLRRIEQLSISIIDLSSK